MQHARAQVTTGARVALRNDSYALHLLLPTRVDPLVSLMKVEKVPDSTYDMIGGLDQQIKEIKEVRGPNHTTEPCPMKCALSVPSVPEMDGDAHSEHARSTPSGAPGAAGITQSVQKLIHGVCAGHRAAHQAPGTL